MGITDEYKPTDVIEKEFIFIGQQVEHILSNHWFYSFYECNECQYQLKLMRVIE